MHPTPVHKAIAIPAMQVLMRPTSIPGSDYRPLRKPLDVELGKSSPQLQPVLRLQWYEQSRHKGIGTAQVTGVQRGM